MAIRHAVRSPCGALMLRVCTWATVHASPKAAKHRNLQVHYGVKGGDLTHSAEAASDTYTAADLCGGIANSSGYIYPGAQLWLTAWDEG